MKKFDTHKFLFTLFHEGRIEGHEIEFLDRDNNLKKVKINSIEIGPSPVTCKIFDDEGNPHRILFIRIRNVYFNGELVWDNTDTDLSNARVIKGYD